MTAKSRSKTNRNHHSAPRNNSRVWLDKLATALPGTHELNHDEHGNVFITLRADPEAPTTRKVKRYLVNEDGHALLDKDKRPSFEWVDEPIEPRDLTADHRAVKLTL